MARGEGSLNASGRNKRIAEQSRVPPPPQTFQNEQSGTSSQALGSLSQPQQQPPEAYPGGPKDLSILIDYHFHVARKIYEDRKTRPMLKINHHHEALIVDWKVDNECPKFQDLVKRSGLYPLIEGYFKSIDKTVVLAFVERWYPETNTFHLPWGEMTITPDDVEKILGIKVQGEPMSGGKVSKTNALSLLDECLGVKEDEWNTIFDPNQGYTVTAKWLRESFAGKAKEDSNNDTLHRAVRAYLLYVLGMCGFAGKGGSRIPVGLLKCLLKVEHLSNIAWGTALLACLFRHLGKASRFDCAQLSGFLTLLEVWIYDHFPDIAPDVLRSEDYVEGEPRVKLYKNVSTSHKGDSELEKLQKKLDNIGFNMIRWNPYESDRREICNFAYFRGVLFGADIMEAYHPDRVLRQFNFVQTVPSPPIPPLKSDTKRFKSSDYKVMYKVLEHFQSEWEHSVIEVSGLPSSLEPLNCSEDYMEWYNSISHPRVHPPLLIGVNDNIWNDEITKVIKILKEAKDLKSANAKQKVINKSLSFLEEISCYKAPPVYQPPSLDDNEEDFDDQLLTKKTKKTKRR